MADFLTRLAGRALGIVATVQPILTPMYAPGQQFIGAEDTQAMPLFEKEVATESAQPEGQAMSQQDRPADEPPFGDPVGQTVHAQKTPLQLAPSFAESMSSPLVPQGSHPSTIPTQTLHTLSRTLDEQPAAHHPLSSERDETAPSAGLESITESTRDAGITGLHSIQSTERASLPLEAPIAIRTAAQGRDPALQLRHAREVLEPAEISSASSLLLPLIPQENRPGAASLISPVADVLTTQMPAEPKTMRPRQGTRQVGYPVYPYNRLNQHEVVTATQESSTPAPTVQVTIGRIEVRATPPPTPRTQAARSAPPVMNLDDYLNQRAKGGH